MKHEQRHRIAQETVNWIRHRYFKENDAAGDYPISFELLSVAIRESFRLAVHPIFQLDIGEIVAVLDRLQLPYDPTRFDRYSALAGFLYAYQGSGIIFLEDTDTEERKKFSLAHELGHFINDYYRPVYLKYENHNTIPLFHEDRASGLRHVISARCTKSDIFGKDEEEIVRAGDRNSERFLVERHREQKEKFKEIKANLFAAELLMPMEECRRIEYENQASTQEELALAVMIRFGVSRSAAAIRVEELGLGFVEERLLCRT